MGENPAKSLLAATARAGATVQIQLKVESSPVNTGSWSLSTRNKVAFIALV
jgi:hypothetical protein